ncbi:mannose-6-phosphate isomerase [Mesoplasma coleopterae]|uniref:type I phosphomannose isomerase catalytic subunit n=1 Tax=Mesoplasma coleopterae TaxID=324078 RepID=UPI000D04735D|nr:type I phosphomannose isomerase catalytic subunit [Mesoplasma coleopterae]AVN62649.1 mannose-6-phosphate isomerase [Mesoplasma coleopterae]
MKVIKIDPHFSEKIWGTKNWKSLGYINKNDKTVGEAWLISAHINGLSYLSEENITLNDFFENNRQYFGNETYMKFPLLSKIINPSKDLSVQVHPNDEYAIQNENDLGKPESWFILECPPNSEIIYGHTAKTKNEFISLVKSNNWNKLLKTEKINKGDFIYVPPGKVHAITAGVKVFELQRSSDVTYRLYDYDRLENGKKRALQIDKSIDNVSLPDNDSYIVKKASGKTFSSNFFSVFIFKSTEHNYFEKYEDAFWVELTVIKGKGIIEGVSLQKGDSAILLGDFRKIKIIGKVEIIFYWIKK